MNNNFDINHIRLLLGKYYEGATSLTEEEQLAAFFNEADDNLIPKDMLADKKLFAAMKELQPRLSESEIPGDLIGMIDEIISQPEVKQSSADNGKKPRLFIRYSALAAAAALLWAIITLMPDFANKNADMPVELTAEVVVHSPAGEYDDTATTLSVAASTDITADEENDNYIEITDPEEARKIVTEIGMLLAQNLDRSNEAISQIGTTFNNYKEITKTILQ
ncbi:MAG: hypothetical protein K2M05_03685 [Paramuribaculum sp.]|nr:hypothetical protein [Paramuribaculum sp.]